MFPNNYYEILGLTSSALSAEIVAAFRSKAKLLHPDVNNHADAPQQFRELFEAYDVLRDGDRRATYDAILARARAVSETDQRRMDDWKSTADAQADRYASMDYDAFLKSVVFEIKYATRNMGALYTGICQIVCGVFLLLFMYPDMRSTSQSDRQLKTFILIVSLFTIGIGVGYLRKYFHGRSEELAKLKTEG